MSFALRKADPDRDAAALLEIYRPFVEGSTTSFEVVAPSIAEFAERIRAAQRAHEWLVAAEGDELLGYAYGGTHRMREAYRHTVEVSVYVGAGGRGRGIGRALYERLFEVLAAQGHCNAVAGITLPNDPSVLFHEQLGFTPIGVFHGVGFKFGAWRDVAWYERRLRAGAPGA
ncbi:MAG: N-acetyltransferase family protein [Planctomycetota bacterium]